MKPVCPCLIRRKEKQTERERGRWGERETQKERRESDEEDRRCKKIWRDGGIVRKALPLTLLHSQPWAASVMLACTYLCISFPLCKIQNCLLRRNNKSIHV